MRTIEPRTPQILGIDLDIEPIDLPRLASVPHLRDDVRQTLVAVEQAKVAQAEAASKASPDDEIAKRKRAAARANLASFIARYDADAAKHGLDRTDEGQAKVQKLAIEAARLQQQHRLAEAELLLAQKRQRLQTAQASETDDPAAKQKQVDEATEALAEAGSHWHLLATPHANRTIGVLIPTTKPIGDSIRSAWRLH